MCIYPPELVLKETTEKNGLVSHLDDGISVRNGQYDTTVYDKRGSFNFKIVNFPLFRYSLHFFTLHIISINNHSFLLLFSTVCVNLISCHRMYASSRL